jgi:hypothetical protein
MDCNDHDNAASDDEVAMKCDAGLDSVGVNASIAANAPLKVLMRFRFLIAITLIREEPH